MRRMSSKTLLTLATALVAVPGAAIAAAEPGEPLFQVASSDTDEIDCEALLEAPEDDGSDDEDALESQELPEECEDDEADADGDGTEGASEDDEESSEDDGTDEEAGDGDVESEDTGEGDDPEDTDGTEEADDDAHGEIVSAVAACAPRGQERVDGFDLPNHGAYVSAAAKGETLEVGDGYDLSTLEGATALCEDLDTARAGAEDPEDAGDSEGDGTEETDGLETSDVEESAPERDAPAGPATEQQRGGENGPPEQAGNGGGGKGAGPQDAPGRNR